MHFFDPLSSAKTAEFVVFIGYDPKEDALAKMMARSIRSRTNMQSLKIVPIVRDELRAYDIFTRPADLKGTTQFSITRFMVPTLMDFQGVGIFFDCDMLITRDIQEMFDLFDPSFALQCVKHDYQPGTNLKMGGMKQTVYPRKNWSSTVIYNCGHPQNAQLTREVVEQAEPKFLHRFLWLKDELIGGLPNEFNFLVEEQDMPETLPFNIHHTLGAPVFREKTEVDYADYWKSEFEATFGRPFCDEDYIN